MSYPVKCARNKVKTMSEEKKTPEIVDENLPAFVKAAPELLPVWDWWVKEGKSTVIMLAVAGLAVGGFYLGRNWIRSREAAATAALVKACPSPDMMSPDALVNAESIADLEKVVSDYGSSKVGPLLRLRLAKGYYETARYEESLGLYDKLAGEKDKIPAFADVVTVGRAFALEGCKKYKDAQEAFSSYAAANTNSYLRLSSQLGAARCKALLGDNSGALKDLGALKADQKNDAVKTRVEKMMAVVQNYDPSRPADSGSLFDAANAAAQLLEAEKKPAAPATAAAPAVPAKPAAPAKAAAPAVPAKPVAPVAPAKPAAPAQTKPAAK